MQGVNEVTLLGTVGKDPVLKEIGSENKVANFSLATGKSYKDKQDQWQEKTTWHNIQVWNKLAEKAVKSITVGTMVFIKGEISNREYDDKDGNKRHITEIIASSILVLNKKKTVEENNTPQPSVNSTTNTETPDGQIDDDLPY